MPAEDSGPRPPNGELPPHSAERPEELARRAEASVRAGRFNNETLMIYEKILTSRPRSATFQKALSIAILVEQIQGMVADREACVPDALKNALRQVVALLADYPNSPDLNKCLGDLRLLTGSLPKAAEAYRRALELGYRPASQALAVYFREKRAGRIPPGADACFDDLQGGETQTDPQPPLPHPAPAPADARPEDTPEAGYASSVFDDADFEDFASAEPMAPKAAEALEEPPSESSWPLASPAAGTPPREEAQARAAGSLEDFDSNALAEEPPGPEPDAPVAPSSPFDSGETIDSPAFRPASSERDSASGASDRTHLASQISSASLENASALSAPSSAEEAPASIAYPQLIDRLSEERPSSAAEPPLSSASEEMLLQASAELAQGRPLEAYRLLRALPMNRESKDLLNRAAEALEGEGLFDEAVEVLRHINEYDFLLHEANRQQELELEIASELELADLHFKNRRFEAALEKYLHALEMGCADVDFATDRIDQIIEQGAHVETRHLLFMGDFFHRRGADEQALIYLNEVLEFDASNTDALRRIQAIFQERIRTHPERLELRLELGLLYLRVGKPSLAIPEFRRAGSIPQLAAAANRRLAEAYILNGQLQQALALYQRTELQTVDLEALYELAGRLEQARMPEDALKAFQAIEKIRDEYRDVQERKLAIREQLAQRAAGEAAAIEYDPKMRDLIGELAIGRYRYIGKLGSGGMGVVHRVFDIKNNTEVAMKILREGLANSQRALSRFIREAQYVDQLQHPNIVRLYDYNISKTPGQSFITMEYIDGPSMREMLETRFKDDIKIDREYMARIVSSVIQVCDALEAVHRKGIIHRDIKPDNIMINSRDEVKITDFGILHVEDGSYTETGALLGTPRYMAPEQVAGSKIDGRADIYAVGILLYEMLTSSPPFISGDIAYQQANTRPTPPREIIPDITPSLNQIIMTCLEKKPDQRYQSARALRAHLVEELQALGGAPPKRDSQANTIEHQTAEGLSGGLSDFDEDFE